MMKVSPSQFSFCLCKHELVSLSTGMTRTKSCSSSSSGEEVLKVTETKKIREAQGLKVSLLYKSYGIRSPGFLVSATPQASCYF